MARTFRLEIVTPEKTVFSDNVVSLVVPAERGYLGVLAGHAPLLCTLRPGEIKIRRDSSELYFATSGGFLEVTPKKSTLLCEAAEAASEIDAERAERARRRAKERAVKIDPSIDRRRAVAALERAEARLRVSRRSGR